METSTSTPRLLLVVGFFGFLGFILLELGSVLVLTTIFYSDEAESLGAYLFIGLSLGVITVSTNHVRKNLQKRNWKVITSDSMTYEVKASVPDNPNSGFVKFTFFCRLIHKTKTKKYSMFISPKNIDNLREVLWNKLDQRGLKALLYTNPSKENKVIYQNEFTSEDALLMPIVLCWEVFLLQCAFNLIYLSHVTLGYGTTLNNLLYSLNLKALPFIEQSPIMYIILLNLLLIVIYLLVLVRGYRQAGLHRYRGHPLFIEEGKETSFDLIRKIRSMVDICPNCGDIIELKETYCANCGLKTNQEA